MPGPISGAALRQRKRDGRDGGSIFIEAGPNFCEPLQAAATFGDTPLDLHVEKRIVKIVRTIRRRIVLNDQRPGFLFREGAPQSVSYERQRIQNTRHDKLIPGTTRTIANGVVLRCSTTLTRRYC
jgi:hypothetical protein